MKLSSLKYFLFLIGLGFSLCSCNTTKKLGPNSVLYTGSEVTFTNEKEVDNINVITEDLLSLIQPKANKQLFGIRINLWIYQRFGKKKGKESKFKKRFGESPVFLDTAQARRNTLRIEKYLQDQGYFHSDARYSVAQKSNKPLAQVNYQIRTKGRYKIREFIYPEPTDSVQKSIHEAKDNSLFKVGNPYILSALQAERQRIAQKLANEGYANFSPAYLYYSLDTLTGDHEVRIKLQLQAASDSSSHRKYFIRNVYIYPNYSLEKAEGNAHQHDTIDYKGITLMGGNSVVRPKILQQNLLIKKGDIYSLKNHRYTQKHLQDLGIYKFVNLKYLPDSISASFDSLDAFVYLTPLQMKEFGATLEQDSRTGLFSGYGTNLSLNYTDRNLFNGAETLKITVAGGVILQPGDTSQLINSLDFSARADLYFPRILGPFSFRNLYRFKLPQTRISAYFNQQQRVGFYALRNTGSSLSYIWNKNTKIKHEFSPLSILATELLNSTEEFDDLLQANPSLRGSFSNTFIIGPNYSFTFQESPKGSRRLYHYFNASADFSGNLLELGSQLFNKQSSTEQHKLLGRTFAQYSLFKWDYRTYYPLNKNQLIAFRFSGGMGIPYGNSEVLPYIRQFFIGGPNSLRSFRIRTLGPGSYEGSNGQTEVSFVDQTGDIALETNIEYRFPLVSYLKGAFFVDAGNIWLFPSRDISDLEPQEKLRYDQGVFNSGQFANQIALGAGLGLRLDVEIFVLRLDIATPLRVPANPSGERWVVSEIKPLNWSWLKSRDNVVMSLAIGYPF